MAKKNTINTYINELKSMIEVRLKDTCPAWLLPQIRATAMNMVMLDQIQEELSKSDIMISIDGSMGQQKFMTNPLLVTYKDLQRTMTAQFEALGLNFNANTNKLKPDGGGSESDRLSELLESVK